MSLQPAINIDFQRIPEAIEETLREQKLSELAFAARTGVSQPVLNRILNARSNKISLRTFQRLWPHIGPRLVTTLTQNT